MLMSLSSIQPVQAVLWLPCSLFGESFLHQSRAAKLGNVFEQRLNEAASRAEVGALMPGGSAMNKASPDTEKLSHTWKIHFHLFP